MSSARRLSIVDLEILCLVPGLPPAPRPTTFQTEPRVVFRTHSSLPACPQSSWLVPPRSLPHDQTQSVPQSPGRPRQHVFRDTCLLANTTRKPYHLPARFLPGFAAKATFCAPSLRATLSCCVPRLRRAYVRGTHQPYHSTPQAGLQLHRCCCCRPTTPSAYRESIHTTQALHIGHHVGRYHLFVCASRQGP